MDLSTFIAGARQRNAFTFRELEKKAGDLSHVYIWRLETGARDAPTAEALEKLAGALELTKREREILHFLRRGPVDDALVRLMLQREDIPWEDFEPVATMSFRGSRPTTEDAWLRLLETVRNLDF